LLDIRQEIGRTWNQIWFQRVRQILY
jgi:hypothetical protein